MKILDRLDISGSLTLASNAKDTFSIGTPLEHNDGQVDSLIVYANADFKNNVIIGSSSIDTLVINAKTTASADVFLSNSSLIITSGTIYVNGQDVLGGQGGGGGGNQGGGNQGGNGNNVQYYEFVAVSSSAYYISNSTGSVEEIFYIAYTGSGTSSIYLPNAYSDNSANRKYTIKNVSNKNVLINTYTSSQKIDYKYDYIVVEPQESYTLHPLKNLNVEEMISWQILETSKNIPTTTSTGSIDIVYSNNSIFLKNITEYTMSNSDVGKEIIFTFNPIATYQEPIVKERSGNYFSSGSVTLPEGYNKWPDKFLTLILPKAEENIGKKFSVKFIATDLKYYKFNMYDYLNPNAPSGSYFSNSEYLFAWLKVIPKTNEYIGFIKALYDQYSIVSSSYQQQSQFKPQLPVVPSTPYYKAGVTAISGLTLENKSHYTIQESNQYSELMLSTLPQITTFTAVSSSEIGYSWLPNTQIDIYTPVNGFGLTSQFLL